MVNEPVLPTASAGPVVELPRVGAPLGRVAWVTSRSVAVCEPNTPPNRRRTRTPALVTVAPKRLRSFEP